MRKSIFLIHFFLLILITSHGQNEGPRFTTKSDFLFGKVKLVTTVTSSIYKNQDNTVIEKELYSNKKIYYENGFVDSTFSKGKDGKYILDYHYFWKGDTLVSTIHPSGVLAKGLFNSKELPIYQYFEIINEQKTEQWYTYDKSQKLLSLMSKLNSKYDTATYKYVISNKKTFTVSVKHTAKQFSEPDGYYYTIDSNLHKLFEVRYYSDKIHKTETKFEYDKWGNLLKQEEFMFTKTKNVWQKASTSELKEYKHNYDEQNNWLQKETIINSVPYQIERRIITYW
jgi:hypothetical protein